MLTGEIKHALAIEPLAPFREVTMRIAIYDDGQLADPPFAIREEAHPIPVGPAQGANHRVVAWSAIKAVVVYHVGIGHLEIDLWIEKSSECAHRKDDLLTEVRPGEPAARGPPRVTLNNQ